MINTMNISQMGQEDMRLRGCSFSGVAKDTSSVLWYTENVGKGPVGCPGTPQDGGVPSAYYQDLWLLLWVSQKDLSSQTLSQKAAYIYDRTTWKSKRLTICPQPEQFWKAVPAPCGVAGGLHRSCTMVQLPPLPSPASLPIADVVSEFTPWLASSTQSSETSSLFPRKCDLWRRLSNLDLIFQQKVVEQGLAPGAACPCGLGPLLLSSAVLHSSLFQSVRQQEIWNFWATRSIRVVVAVDKKRRGDVNFKSRRY